MAIVGARLDYHKKFAFHVSIDKVGRADFKKAGPLEAETAITDTYEGGAVFPRKSLGRSKTTNVKCERGATVDQDLWDWFRVSAAFSQDVGLENIQESDLFRTVEIVQTNRFGRELRRWRFINCLCAKFTGGDWDNDTDDNAVEMLEIAYEVPDLVKNTK